MRAKEARRAAAFVFLCAGGIGLPSLPAARSAEPEWVLKADARTRRAVTEGETAGLSLYVRLHGKTWISRGYGESDLENHVGASPDTVYAIASITKQFTATAVLQLAEAGKLQLDDEITRYLPGYPVRGNRVTVRQLLNHTSGIRNMTALGAPYWSQISRDVQPEDVIRIFQNEPFDFSPGEHYSYSNSGSFLLGVIIEKASGMKYSEYLAKNVIARAGLQHTRSCATDALIPGRARGYSHGSAGFVNAKYFSPTQGFSVGSICSTAPDLARWVEALASGRVVSAESYRQMTTPSPPVLPDGERLTHGFGTGVGINEGHRVFYNDGGIFGFDTIEAYYPRDDLTIIVLCNTDGDLAAEVENAVARFAPGIPPPGDFPFRPASGRRASGRTASANPRSRSATGTAASRLKCPARTPSSSSTARGQTSRSEPDRPSSALSSPSAPQPSFASRSTAISVSSQDGQISGSRPMVEVIEGRYLHDYTVWLKFEDGTEGEVDLSGELHGPLFEPLRDPVYFRSFTVSPDLGTISWPNGADFAPEFLYDKLRVTA